MLRQAVVLLMICTCVLACVETGSRAAFVALALGCVLAGILGMLSRRSRGVGNLIILLVLGAVLVVVAGGGFAGKFNQTIDRFREAGGGDRGQLWGMSIGFIITHPIPDPAGWDNVSLLASHQTFLSAGIAGGVLSMIGLTGAAITSVVLRWRRLKLRPPAGRVWDGALLLIMVTTILGVSSVTAEGHKVMWALFALCGLSWRAQGPGPEEFPADGAVLLSGDRP